MVAFFVIMFYNTIRTFERGMIMLLSLLVKNFALIKETYVEFGEKLNVITGETGAGKSILISAICFALGERADKNNIRNGSEFAQVQLVFDIRNDKNVESILNDLGIDYDDKLIISRKLSIDNKNDIRVNGNIVNLSMLKSITSNLIDIYGQHEHQALLNPNTHISFLDNFIGQDLIPLKERLGELLSNKSEIEKSISSLGGDELSRNREKELLQYNINEIVEANLVLNEDVELEDKKQKIQHTEKIVNSINIATDLLTESNLGSANTNVYNSIKSLEKVSNIDKDLENLCERLRSVKIEIDDISQTLSNKINEYEFNEYELNEIDSRLDKIKLLKSKYGASIEEILEYLSNSQERLNLLEDSSFVLQQLNEKLDNINKEIEQVCGDVSSIRQENAKQFSKLILDELKQLGMGNSSFKVNFEKIAPNKTGYDKIEFLFSANLGEPEKPLTKVISGGEMSRFMLAFKIVMGNTQNINTLIFDEIDSGISGFVSYQVGQKLAKLSRNTQIITVTHLATIASFADSHYQIQKTIQDSHTDSILKKLDYDGEIGELARLTGGNISSKIGLAHAQELKEQASLYVSSLK